jgi:hypothetical protein
MNLNIEEMTTEEKIQTMEMLWDDLCRKQAGIQTPDWHKDILDERERRLQEGKDNFIDWKQAKKEILESIL